jgi:hypothetical protein
VEMLGTATSPGPSKAHPSLDRPVQGTWQGIAPTPTPTLRHPNRTGARRLGPPGRHRAAPGVASRSATGRLVGHLPLTWSTYGFFSSRSIVRTRQPLLSFRGKQFDSFVSWRARCLSDERRRPRCFRSTMSSPRAKKHYLPYLSCTCVLCLQLVSRNKTVRMSYSIFLFRP